MYESYFLTVDEVAETLKVSKSYAYKVIKGMNAELKKQGYFTMSGRVNKQFFIEKTCYASKTIREKE